MNSPYNAPHQGRTSGVHGSPNAALLIDFDNVTMGIRSDLTKELKSLLNSDIIKGKVAVHRAYADWRRYPQYIVPLSEASVDLIFAPAYGSSKKNATDIRLAIDALELVFTRPEIGTFILLSGDSDFSSLVLKLKEYGKYVIGVGIKESSSDLLVQNCDEYYSYNAFTGLTKAGDEKPSLSVDPWDLVEKAIERMVEQNDVMRSDRLKQVILELDSNFDEKELGYSKYNKFLTDAASRGKLKLRKLENGQFEVGAASGRGRGRSATTTTSPSGGGARSDARSGNGGADVTKGASLDGGYALLKRATRELAERPGQPVRDSDVKRRMLEIEANWDESALGFSKFSHFLRQAHNSEIIDLRRATDGIYEVVLPEDAAKTSPEQKERARQGKDASAADQKASGAGQERGPRGGRERGNGGARDHRRAERGERQFDERSAAAAEPETKAKAREERQPEPPAKPAAQKSEEPKADRPKADESKAHAAEAETGPTGDERAPATGTPTASPTADSGTKSAAPVGVGRGRRGRRSAAGGPPPLLEGQTVSLGQKSGSGAAAREPKRSDAPAASTAAPSGGAGTGTDEDTGAGAPVAIPAVQDLELEGVLDAKDMGLPVDAGAVQRYLTNRYRGVGERTAEAMIEAFGAEHVFAALQAAPDRVVEMLGGGRRANALIEAWEEDYARRRGSGAGESAGGDSSG